VHYRIQMRKLWSALRIGLRLAQPLWPGFGKLAPQSGVQITRALLNKLIRCIRIEVVCAGYRLLRDCNSLLRLQLVDQRLNVGRRRYSVRLAVDDESGGRAGSKEREVIDVGLG